MADAEPVAPRFPFRRIALLILLNLAAFAILANVERNVLQAGTFGFVPGPMGLIRAVTADSPASRAGLAVGDFIERGRMSLHDRLALLYSDAGESVTLPVTNAIAGNRTVTVVAVPDAASRISRTFHVFDFPLMLIVSLSLATAIVLLRPGAPATIFCAFVWLSAISSYQGYFYFRGEAAAELASILIYQLVWVASLCMLALFSTRLFNPNRTWQFRCEMTILLLALLDFSIWLYLSLQFAIGVPRFGLPWEALGETADVLLAVSILVVLATIVPRALEETRHRVRWILVGLSLQPALIVINALHGLVQEALAGWSTPLVSTPIYDLLNPWFAMVGAVAVSYGFINERIIDIRFAVGRASGFAITSAVLVLVVTVCEWSVGELFADSHAASYATLVVAILAGFSFNSIHHRIEQLLDLIFFRREFEAEQRLQRVARAITYATSERAILEFVLDEPVEALELASAALFVLDEKRGVYTCAAMRAWPEDTIVSIPADDPLVAQLRSEREPLALHALDWSFDGLPTGAQEPIVAVPAIAHSDLYAFAFFGAHRDGASLNREELALLGAVVANAAAAFDHLDAIRVRNELERLRRDVSNLENRGSLET